MAILNADALRTIEGKLAQWKQYGHTPHGYPLAEVTDLCDTIAAIRAQKKKFQRLAEHRAQAIADIFSTASRAIERLD
jgi:hypothetical protein